MQLSMQIGDHSYPNLDLHLEGSPRMYWRAADRAVRDCSTVGIFARGPENQSKQPEPRA